MTQMPDLHDVEMPLITRSGLHRACGLKDNVTFRLQFITQFFNRFRLQNDEPIRELQRMLRGFVGLNIAIDVGARERHNQTALGPR